MGKTIDCLEPVPGPLALTSVSTSTRNHRGRPTIGWQSPGRICERTNNSIISKTNGLDKAWPRLISNKSEDNSQSTTRLELSSHGRKQALQPSPGESRKQAAARKQAKPKSSIIEMPCNLQAYKYIRPKMSDMDLIAWHTIQMTWQDTIAWNGIKLSEHQNQSIRMSIVVASTVVHTNANDK